MLIKTVKKIRMNGAIVEPGEVIRVDKDQGLMARGYARELTREETRGVLADYVQFAEKIFNEPVRPDTPCKNCHRSDYWLSIHGVWRCRTCHPPASTKLIKIDLVDHEKTGKNTTTGDRGTMLREPPNSNE